MNDLPTPYHREAETVLLSCIMRMPEILLEETFTEQMFDFPRNLIFRHVCELLADSDQLEWGTVLSSFSPAELEEIGGKETLSDMLFSSYVALDWRFQYENVLEAYQRRKQIEFFRKHLELCYNMNSVWDEDAWLKYEPEVKSRPPKVKTRKMFNDALGRICDRQADTGRMHLTGIQRLDQTLGYVRPGNVVVIGAQTSLGKSAMAHNIAASACMNGGSKKAAIFSMEMTKDEVCERIFAGQCNILIRDIRDQDISLEQKLKMQSFINEKIPDDYPLMIVDESIQDVGVIVSLCKRFRKEHGLDLVVVDYLQLISPASAGKESNRQIEVATVSRKLKIMAKELNVIVVSLSQLNEQNQLRESRAIGQDADIVLHIVDPGGDDKSSLREIHVMKSRNGPKDTIEVDFFPPYASFSNRPLDA